MLNDIHADAAMSLESGYQVYDAFVRVNEHDRSIVNALLRREIELSIHLPCRKFDVYVTLPPQHYCESHKSRDCDKSK